MYYIYVLQSEVDGSHYIGSTKNVERRVWEHNFGSTRYTKRKRPWKLVYKEEYKTKTEALKREKYLKGLRNSKYLEEIMGL